MLRHSSLLLFLAVVALLAGCAATDGGRPLATTLPAAFTGTLPCLGREEPHCAAESQLDLLPDQLFLLSQQSDAEVSVHLGRWLLSTDGRQLRLYGADDSPLTLNVVPDQLRLVAPAGDFRLQRARYRAEPSPVIELRGLYQPATAAGVAIFRECLSGVEMAVAGEGAAQLATTPEHEGQSAMTGEAQPLLAVAGRVAPSARASAPRLEVERLVHAWPDRQCEARATNVPLPGSVWRLVEVDGYRLPESNQRPAFLQFDEQGGVSGSTGCNRVAGRYTRTGAALQLSDLAATRMSCPGSAVLEQLVTDLLRNVAGWNVLESTLELYDEAGTLLGRFEAQDR